MKEFNAQTLIQFLLNARKKCWAGKSNRILNTQRPDFKEFEFNQGLWNYRDSYTGFYSVPGQEIIRYQSLPVWSMSYSGGVIAELIGNEKESKKIFEFLKQALLNVTEDHPFRGPREYSELELFYQCGVEGDITNFSGKEIIWKAQEMVFSQQIIGGSIIHKLTPQSL